MYSHFKNSGVFHRLPANVKSKVSSLETKLVSTLKASEGTRDFINLRQSSKLNSRLLNRLLNERRSYSNNPQLVPVMSPIERMIQYYQNNQLDQRNPIHFEHLQKQA
jgi:hypothetical protein